MEIVGQYATAVVYANVIEDEAIKQIKRMCDYPFTEGSRIRIMPDVHAGKGCTIGTTMTVHGRAVPNVVGVDIGCGMYTLRLAEKEPDLEQLDRACHGIPSGMNVWNAPRERFDMTGLACYTHLSSLPRLACSLGTLGGGNHFIEVDKAADGTLYLVIHSGSRNLGKQVAEYYQKLAVKLHSDAEEDLQAKQKLISAYKAEGRQREIAGALIGMNEAASHHERTLPDDLCYLYGEPLADYLHDVEICQAFARRSRELMAELILADTGLHAEEGFHTIHNYIDTNEMILRKGAIAAHKGEKVLIPINMRDGAVLAIGRGNPEWNQSAPHGAGRILSRSAARTQLDMSAYREAMKDVYTTCVNEHTLDESPMAYKSLADIIDVIRGSVDVIEVIRPVYNFKAAE